MATTRRSSGKEDGAVEGKRAGKEKRKKGTRRVPDILSRRKHDGADPASGGAMKGAQRSKGKIADDDVDGPRPSKDGPAARRDILAASLRARKLRYAIISNPKHVFYLTGFTSNLNAALTIMKGPRSTSFLAVGSGGECSLLVGKTEVQTRGRKVPKTRARDTRIRGRHRDLSGL